MLPRFSFPPGYPPAFERSESPLTSPRLLKLSLSVSLLACNFRIIALAIASILNMSSQPGGEACRLPKSHTTTWHPGPLARLVNFLEEVEAVLACLDIEEADEVTADIWLDRGDDFFSRRTTPRPESPGGAVHFTKAVPSGTKISAWLSETNPGTRNFLFRSQS